ncbi:hypothetical protein [Candidatus Magnetomonas plexicatena]|uniref:hypothetical protein n=1 Tax=Candidatus Magnetomonas plexicatena TaxID=2552947 RepID=UPI001C77F776|nr:hypothetical protein E2O03_003690 [Nitrospirales bacterium LBB_01]
MENEGEKNEKSFYIICLIAMIVVTVFAAGIRDAESACSTSHCSHAVVLLVACCAAGCGTTVSCSNSSCSVATTA